MLFPQKALVLLMALPLITAAPPTANPGKYAASSSNSKYAAGSNSKYAANSNSKYGASGSGAFSSYRNRQGQVKTFGTTKQEKKAEKQTLVDKNWRKDPDPGVQSQVQKLDAFWKKEADEQMAQNLRDYNLS